MHVFSTLEELLHEELNMARLQLHPFVLEQACEIVVHVREDHVHRERAVFAAYIAVTVSKSF
jgi:hypothetical protein